MHLVNSRYMLIGKCILKILQLLENKYNLDFDKILGD